MSAGLEVVVMPGRLGPVGSKVVLDISVLPVFDKDYPPDRVPWVKALDLGASDRSIYQLHLLPHKMIVEPEPEVGAQGGNIGVRAAILWRREHD